MEGFTSVLASLWATLLAPGLVALSYLARRLPLLKQEMNRHNKI